MVILCHVVSGMGTYSPRNREPQNTKTASYETAFAAGSMLFERVFFSLEAERGRTPHAQQALYIEPVISLLYHVNSSPLHFRRGYRVDSRYTELFQRAAHLIDEGQSVVQDSKLLLMRSRILLARHDALLKKL